MLRKWYILFAETGSVEVLWAQTIYHSGTWDLTAFGGGHTTHPNPILRMFHTSLQTSELSQCGGS